MYLLDISDGFGCTGLTGLDGLNRSQCPKGDDIVEGVL